MYSDSLPACPIKQVTKLRDVAFLSVQGSQHLIISVGGHKKKLVIIIVRSPTFYFLTNMSLK